MTADSSAPGGAGSSASGAGAPGDRAGASLVRARWSRAWSSFAALASGVLGGLTGWMAVGGGEVPVAMRLLAGVLALALGAAFVRSLHMLVAPPVLFEAREDGLVVYRNGPRYGGPGFCVPWSRVRSMELVRRTLQSGGTRRRVRTIAVKVRCDGGWSLSPEVGHYPDGTPDTLHLDADSPRPGGEELLRQLRLARQCWS